MLAIKSMMFHALTVIITLRMMKFTIVVNVTKPPATKVCREERTHFTLNAQAAIKIWELAPWNVIHAMPFNPMMEPLLCLRIRNYPTGLNNMDPFTPDKGLL